MYDLAQASSNYPGTLNLGLLSLVLARARLRAHGDPLLQVHPALHKQVLATDLGAKLLGLFQLPYAMPTPAFGHPSGLTNAHPESGQHEAKGSKVPDENRQEPLQTTASHWVAAHN